MLKKEKKDKESKVLNTESLVTSMNTVQSLSNSADPKKNQQPSKSTSFKEMFENDDQAKIDLKLNLHNSFKFKPTILETDLNYSHLQKSVSHESEVLLNKYLIIFFSFSLIKTFKELI